MKPDVCTLKDFEEIKDSDLLIAIPGDPPSGGVHIELGWASAMNKNIIILLEKGKRYCDLANGLAIVANVKYIRYKEIRDCFPEIDKIIGV